MFGEQEECAIEENLILTTNLNRGSRLHIKNKERNRKIKKGEFIKKRLEKHHRELKQTKQNMVKIKNEGGKKFLKKRLVQVLKSIRYLNENLNKKKLWELKRKENADKRNLRRGYYLN